MNYLQFHVGDWDSSTRLLSPVEKGIYIDLLMLYYSLERPLMRSECERISRAYTSDEKDALKYVLERFFKLENDCYCHTRCDEEIAAYRDKSAKAAASAKARWDKGRQKKAKSASTEDRCENGAAEEQSQCERMSERNADGMLTNNQEPITNKDISSNEEISTPPAAAPAPRKRSAPVARPEEVTQQHWDDWGQIRKAKKLPVTQTALDGLRREAEKAGLSLDQTIAVCCERGWAGFKASWYEKDKTEKTAQQQVPPGYGWI